MQGDRPCGRLDAGHGPVGFSAQGGGRGRRPGHQAATGAGHQGEVDVLPRVGVGVAEAHGMGVDGCGPGSVRLHVDLFGRRRLGLDHRRLGRIERGPGGRRGRGHVGQGHVAEVADRHDGHRLGGRLGAQGRHRLGGLGRFLLRRHRSCDQDLGAGEGHDRQDRDEKAPGQALPEPPGPALACAASFGHGCPASRRGSSRGATPSPIDLGPHAFLRMAEGFAGAARRIGLYWQPLVEASIFYR